MNQSVVYETFLTDAFTSAEGKNYWSELRKFYSEVTYIFVYSILHIFGLWQPNRCRIVDYSANISEMEKQVVLSSLGTPKKCVAYSM